jgi:hypothetical protein
MPIEIMLFLSFFATVAWLVNMLTAIFDKEMFFKTWKEWAYACMGSFFLLFIPFYTATIDNMMEDNYQVKQFDVYICDNVPIVVIEGEPVNLATKTEKNIAEKTVDVRFYDEAWLMGIYRSERWELDL